jgi:3-oxoacyl-[acyl-carrier protein] reductase
MAKLYSHLAEHHITVNSGSPVIIVGTGMWPVKKCVPGVVETTPLGRLYKPVEVANIVFMLVTTGF